MTTQKQWFIHDTALAKNEQSFFQAFKDNMCPLVQIRQVYSRDGRQAVPKVAKLYKYQNKNKMRDKKVSFESYNNQHVIFEEVKPVKTKMSFLQI